MYFEKLTLQDFRGFERLELALRPDLTLLVGENGSGKSTILFALESLARGFAANVLGRPEYRFPPAESDIRIGAQSSLLAAMVGGIAISQTQTRGMVADVQIAAPPVVARSVRILTTISFGTNRSVLRGSHERALRSSPQPAWDTWLNPDFTSFELLAAWFLKTEDFENQEKVRRRDLSYADPHLSAVRKALSRVLPLTDPRMDRSRAGDHQFVFSKGGMELEADQLSDGERSLMVIASSIAQRLAGVTPAGEDPLEQPALILIDEIELHLHPKWQRAILGKLRQTFPRCQFVVTSHSAPVIGSVAREHVVVLENFQAFPTSVVTRGRDATAILEELMGLPRHPENVSAILTTIEELIEREELATARDKLRELAVELGPHDYEVVRLDKLLDFLGAPR
ncbi:MAG: AAA family ATPase [Polyangiaceae bacterium]